MNLSFKLFSYSAGILFLGWIAKMQFISGGDYLLRIGTIGFLISFCLQMINSVKSPELKENDLTTMFLLNSICLTIAYLGMMLKVAHVMNSQFEKDLVLDFFGIPAIVTIIIYTFSKINLLTSSCKEARILYFRNILFPWILFLFSFLLYAVYSVILARAS